MRWRLRNAERLRWWAMSRRVDVMTDLPAVGDLIIAGGDYSAVTEIRVHGPDEHPASPIREDLRAVEYVTDRGSRWRGLGAEECVCPRYTGPSRFGQFMQRCRDNRPEATVWCACIGWRDADRRDAEQ
jgi:hypothetical protein